MDVVNADGTGDRNVVPDTGLDSISSPTWSPSGQQIAYFYWPGSGPWTINVINGFLVTDRMLEMFKGKRPEPRSEEEDAGK